MKIVDNNDILCTLKKEYNDSESIVIPIYSDINKHRLYPLEKLTHRRPRLPS